MKKYTVVILAAGNSSRLGRPKQLLTLNGLTLLERISGEALEILSADTVIITGAEKDSLEKIMSGKEVNFIHNEDWQSGMASSVKKGLEKSLEINPNLEAVIFCVSDQPYVNRKIIAELILKFEETKKITASHYDGIAGVPALFPKAFFSHLLHLNGNEGAKKLLKKYEKNLCLIPFKEGIIDIDTIQDYENLAHSYHF